MFTYKENPVHWQKCPVCQGKGHVPMGFYRPSEDHKYPDECRTCNGKGIIAMPNMPDVAKDW